MSVRVVCLCGDLLFRARIAETARAAGTEVAFAATAGQVGPALGAEPPAILLLDLSRDAQAVLAGVSALRPRLAGTRVVAFYSHVDREIGRLAHEAGCDEVLARSRFVERLPALLSGLPPT